MSKRTDIKRLGEHGNRVILFKEGHLARVQWRRNGRLLTKSFPKSMYGSEALAFARGVVTSSAEPAATAPSRVTLRALWNAYEESEFAHLRERTKQLYREHWEKWEIMYGRDFPVDDTTKLMMPHFVAALRKGGLAPASIKETVRVIKYIYSWGEELDLVTRNRVHGYKLKVHKDERPKPRAEYRGDEFSKMLAAFDPNSSTQWRPWVALTICGNQGARQNSVLHLQWTDIHFDTGRMDWRAEWDKMGKAWSQPMRAATIAALRVAQTHHNRMSLLGAAPGPMASKWVFPSGSSKNADETYTIQSLWAATKGAQERGGVDNIPGRGAHGLRRMLAGDVMAATGDPSLATGAINDGIGQAPRYIKKRDDMVDAAILQLDEVK